MESSNRDRNREQNTEEDPNTEEIDHERVERLIGDRAKHRNRTEPSGHGEITNPETHHQETTQDSDLTDPFHEDRERDE